MYIKYKNQVVNYFNKLEQLGLFTTEEANQFSSVVDNYPAMKCLSYLMRAKLFSKTLAGQNFKKFLSIYQDVEELRSILKILYHRNLLTQKNFDAILKHPHDYILSSDVADEALTYGTIYIRCETNILYYTLLAPNKVRIEDSINTNELESPIVLCLTKEERQQLQNFYNGSTVLTQISDNALAFLKAQILIKTSSRRHTTSRLKNFRDAIFALSDINHRHEKWGRIARASHYSITGYLQYSKMHQDLLSIHKDQFAQKNLDLIDACTIIDGRLDDALIKIAEDMRWLNFYGLLTSEIRDSILRRNAPAGLIWVLAQFNQQNILNSPDITLYLQTVLSSKNTNKTAFAISLINARVIDLTLKTKILELIANVDNPDTLTIAICILFDKELLTFENLDKLVQFQNSIANNIFEKLWDVILQINLTQTRFDTIVELANTSIQELDNIRQEYTLPRENYRRLIKKEVKSRRDFVSMFGQSPGQARNILTVPADSVEEMIEDYIEQCVSFDEQQIKPESTKANIFYEITAPNGNKSYLFGTYHSSDIGVISLPIEIKQAFDTATCFMMETNPLDIDLSEMLGPYQALLNKHKEYLSNPISKQFKLDLEKALRIQYPDLDKKSAYEKQMILQMDVFPMQVAALLIQDPCQSEYSKSDPLDFRLLYRALENNKKIVYLEKTDLCVSRGLTLSYQEHLEFYHFVINNLELCKKKQITDKKVLLEAYLSGNIELLHENISKLDNAPQAVKKFYSEFIEQRDVIMATNMQLYLNEEKAFVAVGAMHLNGIIGQLRNAGFEVKNITLSKKQYGIKECNNYITGDLEQNKRKLSK